MYELSNSHRDTDKERKLEKEAKCLCGSLSSKAEGGEPTLSIVCNCVNCQRRTGSPFAAINYFQDAQITGQSGAHKILEFKSDSGNTNKTFFCPDCGTTLFFKLDLFGGQTGIASGCFTDPVSPEPTMAVWTRSKYRCVEFPEHWHSLETQP